MKLIPFYDLVAGLASLMLIAAVITLAILGRGCPEELRSAVTLALGWIFRSGVQLQNELRHQERSAPND
jgi:hypothetical protein